jgi:ArsR family metal-binding transcriptional regulator
MPQVPKGSAQNFLVKYIAALSEEQIIRVENHKNDRFLIIRKSGKMVEIREDGYTNTTHTVEPSEVKSVLGKLLDYEFPRSHQLRIKIRKPMESNDIGMSPWSSRKVR